MFKGNLEVYELRRWQSHWWYSMLISLRLFRRSFDIVVRSLILINFSLLH